MIQRTVLREELTAVYGSIRQSDQRSEGHGAAWLRATLQGSTKRERPAGEI